MKRPATKSADKKGSFPAVFAALRAILAEHADGLIVRTDDEKCYYLDTTKPHPTNGGPMMFGAVRVGKAYVSFHLMPVYGCPDLLEGMSEGLRKRMQGKACFNFKELDPKLSAELRELTVAGLKRFKRAGMA